MNAIEAFKNRVLLRTFFSPSSYRSCLHYFTCHFMTILIQNSSNSAISKARLVVFKLILKEEIYVIIQ